MNEMAGIKDQGRQDWQDALLAIMLARVMATGARLPGFLLTGGSRTACETWLSELQASFYPLPFKTLPASTCVHDLVGQLDIGNTLASGRATWESGLLENTENGYLVIRGGERIAPDVLHLVLEQAGSGRLGLVVFEEDSDGQERTAERLVDHLDFHLDLSLVQRAIMDEDHEPFVSSRLGDVGHSSETADRLCRAALQLGLTSLRPPKQALGVAVAHARLSESGEVGEDAIAAAIRLSLLNRALMVPGGEADTEAIEPEQSSAREAPETPENAGSEAIPRDLDVAIEGVRLPEGLVARVLAGLARKTNTRSGVSGQKPGPERGRPRPSRKGMPGRDGRADVFATLQAAAPWQEMRKQASPGKAGLRIFPRDLYVKRYQQTVETLTIFVVDASGSTALNRLGEAKGAVETLLGESYRTRAHVALVSFRRERAELVLPPTRSLTRAKRCLANLQGGGGTPLADGLRLASSLAEEQARLGRNVSIVLLTDGSANIALDGTVNRQRAMDDALQFARTIHAQHNSVVLLDVGRTKSPKTANLAEALGARHVPMPFSSSRNIVAGLGLQ